MRHCEAHKQPGERNIVDRPCKSCHLEGVLNEAGECEYCREAPANRGRFLEKQQRVGAALRAAGLEIEREDQVVAGECSKRRPDFVLDGLHQKVVVEVDEHQHARGEGYRDGCEVRRMWEIVQALGGATVFVRFNPDSWKDAHGRRQTKPEAADREAELVRWVRALQKREPEGVASVLYLFYDGQGETVRVERLPDLCADAAAGRADATADEADATAGEADATAGEADATAGGV